MLDNDSHKNLQTHGASWSDSILWFVLTALAGLATTAYLFAYFVRLDLNKVETRLERGAQTLTYFATQPAMDPLIAQLVGVLTGVQNDIYAGAEISEELLRSWLWEQVPPGLETATIEYLPRVNRANLEEFTRQLAGPDIQNFVMLHETAAGFVPASPQDEYFPVMIQAASGQTHAPRGLDRANNELINLAMAGARDSGMIGTYASFPLAGYDEHDLISHYFMPMYTSGAIPATIEERRRQLTGFVAVSTYQPSAEMLAFLSEDFQGIDAAYFAQSADLATDESYSAIKARLDARDLITLPYEVTGIPFKIGARASGSLARTLVTPTRWWVLCIGMLITVWISSMLLWFRNQSQRIRALVTKRTRDLAERTSELSGANSALMESESRYRMLADNASDVIYTCDLNGKYTYISPSILQQQGFAPEELLGHFITAQLPENSAQKLLSVLSDARNDQYRHHARQADSSVSKFESQVLCKDGTMKWLETTASLLTDIAGKPTDLLCVSRDITDRKKTEQEKLAWEDAYRQSQKMEAIGTLAGGIAHDFNNLLTGIFGYAEILRMQLDDNPDAEESIDVIEKAATRARELTSKLLGFARKSRYQGVPVNLNETILEVVGLLKGTIDKRIEIRTDLDALPAVVVGDPDQLHHVLLNLAINARDAMPSGGKLLFSTRIENIADNSALIHPDLLPGAYNVIRVADTGIGIAKQNHARIFEPFFTDKEQGKGTGLGLAMVYGVAKSHGGIVLVQSEPGQGATFVLYLPYNAEVVDNLLVEKFELATEGTGRILLVDDEAVIRTMTSSLLKAMGYSVVLAADGASALQIYERDCGEIDLVIVDMVMPVMGGSECIRGLKEINPDVRIILSTGYSRETVAEQINSSELSGFLPKPYGRQQLSRVLADTLQTQLRH